MVEVMAAPGFYGPGGASVGGCVYDGALGSGSFGEIAKSGIETAVRAMAVDAATTRGEIQWQIGRTAFKVRETTYKDKLTKQDVTATTLVDEVGGQTISRVTDGGEYGNGTPEEYRRIVDRANLLAQTEGDASMFWVSPGKEANGVNVANRAALLLKKGDTVTQYWISLSGDKKSLGETMKKLGYEDNGKDIPLEDQVIIKKGDNGLSRKDVYNAFVQSLTPADMAGSGQFIRKLREEVAMSDGALARRQEEYQREYEKQIKSDLEKKKNIESTINDIKEALGPIAQGYAAIPRVVEDKPDGKDIPEREFQRESKHNEYTPRAGEETDRVEEITGQQYADIPGKEAEKTDTETGNKETVQEKTGAAMIAFSLPLTVEQALILHEPGEEKAVDRDGDGGNSEMKVTGQKEGKVKAVNETLSFALLARAFMELADGDEEEIPVNKIMKEDKKLKRGEFKGDTKKPDAGAVSKKEIKEGSDSRDDEITGEKQESGQEIINRVKEEAGVVSFPVSEKAVQAWRTIRAVLKTESRDLGIGKITEGSVRIEAAEGQPEGPVILNADSDATGHQLEETPLFRTKIIEAVSETRSIKAELKIPLASIRENNTKTASTETQSERADEFVSLSGAAEAIIDTLMTVIKESAGETDEKPEEGTVASDILNQNQNEETERVTLSAVAAGWELTGVLIPEEKLQGLRDGKLSFNEAVEAAPVRRLTVLLTAFERHDIQPRVKMYLAALIYGQIREISDTEGERIPDDLREKLAVIFSAGSQMEEGGKELSGKLNRIISRDKDKKVSGEPAGYLRPVKEAEVIGIIFRISGIPGGGEEADNRRETMENNPHKKIQRIIETMGEMIRFPEKLKEPTKTEVQNGTEMIIKEDNNNTVIRQEKDEVSFPEEKMVLDQDNLFRLLRIEAGFQKTVPAENREEQENEKARSEEIIREIINLMRSLGYGKTETETVTRFLKTAETDRVRVKNPAVKDTDNSGGTFFERGMIKRQNRGKIKKRDRHFYQGWGTGYTFPANYGQTLTFLRYGVIYRYTPLEGKAVI